MNVSGTVASRTRGDSCPVLGTGEVTSSPVPGLGPSVQEGQYPGLHEALT